MSALDLITTRPLLPAYEAFVYQVYSSTRADEMALIPWTEAQKEAFVHMQFQMREQHYHAAYPEAVTQIILCNGVPAGTLITDRTAETIHLVDISLLASFRGIGLGTAILRNLQKEGKKITLHVLKQNPAVHLYSRLGFVTTGEDSMYLSMEWSPR